MNRVSLFLALGSLAVGFVLGCLVNSRRGEVVEVPAEVGHRVGNVVLSDVFDEVALVRFPQLLEEASQTSEGALRDGRVAVVVTEWASRDPEVALDFLLSSEVVGSRVETLRLALVSYAAVNPQAAVDWMQRADLTEEERTSISQVVFAEVASSDAQLAVNLALEMDDGEVALGQVLSRWGEEDAPAVLGWLVHEEVVNESVGDAVSGVLARYVEDDFVGAGMSVQELSEGTLKQILMCEYAVALVAHDPLRAAQWTEQITEDGSGAALSAVVERWAESDAMAALDYVSRQAMSPRRDRLMVAAAARAAESAPVRLAESLDRLSDAVQGAVAARVSEGYFLEDADAASVWFESLRSGPVREQAAYAALANLVKTDADEALMLALELKYETGLLDYASLVVTQWAAEDRESALRAVERAASLTAEERLVLKLALRSTN